MLLCDDGADKPDIVRRDKTGGSFFQQEGHVSYAEKLLVLH